jgi:hypothetical protein
MKVFSKIDVRFWFAIFITALFFIYYYQKVLFLPPESVHQWRQTDCISLAMNFMQENNPLKPEIHNRISDGGTSGYSAGEFTGLYYLVGKIWNFTGVNLAIYRAINLFIFILSCFVLLNSLKSFFENNFWALFVSLFLFTSPLLVFYSPNFLTDITALSFSIFAFSYFIKFIATKNKQYFLISALLFAIGGLFKVTALITFLAIGAVFFFEWIGILKNGKALFKPHLNKVLIFISSLVLVFIWYWYAEYYNDIHGGKYTFNNLWPIWSLSDEAYQKAVNSFSEFIFYQLFNPFVSWVLILIYLTTIIVGTIKKEFKIVFFLLIQLIGSLLYIILWFAALDGHDYYFINLFIFPVVLLTSFLYLLKKHYSNIFNHFAFKSFAVFLLLIGISYSAINIRLRYNNHMAFNKSLANFYFGNEQVDLWGYIAYTQKNDPRYTIENYNRTIGIKKEDLVVSLPDPSINISLVLMNQKGWTTFGGSANDSLKIENAREVGAKYLILKSEEMKNSQSLKVFTQEKDSVGFYNGIWIYKLF